MAASESDIAYSIRGFRLRAGLSQEELAERAGVSARAISDMERGLRKNPRPETFRLLADALALDAAERAAFFASAHPAPNASAPSNGMDVPGSGEQLTAFPLPVPRYTRSGDGNIAWNTFGDGPIDLVLVPGFISHLEHDWALPAYATWLRRLGTLARVAAFDKRGTGLSDRVGRVLTIEERADDIRAVMDAAGFERAVIFGISEGGSLAALFAATHPERTIGLMIYGGLASYVARPDYPWPPTHDEYQRRTEEMEETLHERWGTDELAREIIDMMAPSGANDPDLISWMAKFMRLGASPGAEIARRKMNIELDVRGILPTISVPSLVLHRTGESDVNVKEGRYIAAHIPGCRFAELPGNDHFPELSPQEPMFSAIESFLGALAPHQADAATVQKLVTALCLDIPLGVPDVGEAVIEHVDTVVAGYGGKIVEQKHRKLVALFDGSIRAMRCGLDVLELLKANGLEGRIGAHSGAVGNENAPGDAVDVAARLASMTVSGSIIVTQSVRVISPGSGVTFEPIGEQQLVESQPPLLLYRIVRQSGDAKKAQAPTMR
jgi:pimeloyl-ACP methyl ester carboxylesterase/DNA-binding XRE family transcriptional regulator